MEKLVGIGMIFIGCILFSKLTSKKGNKNNQQESKVNNNEQMMGEQYMTDTNQQYVETPIETRDISQEYMDNNNEIIEETISWGLTENIEDTQVTGIEEQ